MLTEVNPMLPMRNKATTKEFYTKLGFTDIGKSDFDQYLIIQKDNDPNGKLQNKPWLQREISILNPDNNLLISGQSI